MRNFSRHISFTLLLIVSVFILPKELIHSFTGHEDTLCEFEKQSGISEKHTHCDFLHFVIPHFTVEETEPSVFLITIIHHCYQGVSLDVASSDIHQFNLRGPPLV